MNRTLWINRRVPARLKCEHCNTIDSSAYDYTDSEQQHRYVCKNCHSVKLYSVDEINRRYFERFHFYRTA